MTGCKMSFINLSEAMIGLLAKFNGFSEPGISVRPNKGLQEAFRLRLLKDVSAGDIIKAAYATATDFYNRNPGSWGQDVLEFAAIAAFTIYIYGMTGRIPDDDDANLQKFPAKGSDFDYVSGRALLSTGQDLPDHLFEVEKCKAALTVIVATKISWWLTNHHTGGTRFSRYIERVVRSQCPKLETNKEVIEMVNCIGHWASTHIVLNASGIKVAQPYLRTNWTGERVLLDFHLRKDFKLRTQGWPAGTDKHSVPNEIFKKFGENQGALYLLSHQKVRDALLEAHNFEESARKYAACIDDDDRKNFLMSQGISPYNGHFCDPRAYYHRGSQFLTGCPRKFFNTEDIIGLAGSLMFHFYPRSHLCDSVYIRQNKKSVYQNHGCFDPNVDRVFEYIGSRGGMISSEQIAKMVSGLGKLVGASEWELFKELERISREEMQERASKKRSSTEQEAEPRPGPSSAPMERE